MQRIIDGMQIVNKYSDATLLAEHNVIYLWARNISEDDRKKLLELEWSNDEPNHYFTYV